MGKIVNFARCERKKTEYSSDVTPAIYYAVGAFKAFVKKLVAEGEIKHFVMKDFTNLVLQNRYLRVEDITTIQELPERTRAEMILAMCQNIHDGWVYEHASEFSSRYEGMEFIYLPLEWIGVEQLAGIFRPLEKALVRFGLAEVSLETVIEVYDEKRQEIFKGVSNLYGLIRTLQKAACEYQPLRPDLKEFFENPEVGFRVARQIAYHMPEVLAV